MTILIFIISEQVKNYDSSFIISVQNVIIMIYLLLLTILFVSINCEFYSNHFTFIKNNNLQSNAFNHFPDAVLLYCISQIEFNKPFALVARPIFTQSQFIDVLQIEVDDSAFLGASKIVLKYFVSSKLQGFQSFALKFTNQYPTKMFESSATSVPGGIVPIVKTGYFITGFSNTTLLSTANVTAFSSSKYMVSFILESPQDWIQIQFFRIDLTPGYGCLGNDIVSGALTSVNGNKASYSWDIAKTQNFEILGGLSEINSFTGFFTWNKRLSQAQASKNGSFKYQIFQIDTKCISVDPTYHSTNVKPIMPATPQTVSSNNKPQVIPLPLPLSTPMPPPSPQIIPPNSNYPQPPKTFWSETTTTTTTTMPFRPQNSSLPQASVATLPFPTINGSNRALPIHDTPIRPIVLTEAQKQIISQTVPNAAIVADATVLPQPTRVIFPEPTRVYADSATSLNSVNQVPSEIVVPIHAEFTSSSRQTLIDAPPTNDQQSTIYYSDTHISAWKILGYVILIWIGISLFALPILCCALKQIKPKNQRQEVIERIQYEQQVRGTDVRLVRDIDGPILREQLFGNFRNRNSQGSQVTVEMMPSAEPNSDPNTEAFRSQIQSKISRNPTTIKQKQPITYEEMKSARAQSIDNSKPFPNKNLIRESVIGRPQIVSDFPSDKESSSRLSNSPSSNFQTLSKIQFQKIDESNKQMSLLKSKQQRSIVSKPQQDAYQKQVEKKEVEDIFAIHQSEIGNLLSSQNSQIAKQNDKSYQQNKQQLAEDKELFAIIQSGNLGNQKQEKGNFEAFDNVSSSIFKIQGSNMTEFNDKPSKIIGQENQIVLQTNANQQKQEKSQEQKEQKEQKEQQKQQRQQIQEQRQQKQEQQQQVQKQYREETIQKQEQIQNSGVTSSVSKISKPSQINQTQSQVQKQRKQNSQQQKKQQTIQQQKQQQQQSSDLQLQSNIETKQLTVQKQQPSSPQQIEDNSKKPQKQSSQSPEQN